MVIGGIDGQLSSIFEKLSKLQSKNSFSFAIVVGDLFADPSLASPQDDATTSSLLDGKISVPLPTYFTVGGRALPQKIIDRLETANGEVCTNLYFMSKRSTTKTSEGVRIVNLGGVLDPDITAILSKEGYLPFHTEGDAKSLHGANTADILLTSTWPSSIQTGSNIPLPENTEPPTSEQCVAELCASLRPRYHFSNSPSFFFEREPFFHAPRETHPGIRFITRFISLASPNSSAKAKYLYAFSLDPTSPQPSTLPPGTTVSPLRIISSKKRFRANGPDQDDLNTYSRFSTYPTHHQQSKRIRQPPPGPAECFFCLSNPQLATHLITSIANEAYLTTAKGPLPTTETYPSLGPFPAHILIIPFTHTPTLAALPDAATYAEMQRYRSALHAMLAAKASRSLGAVTWEVSTARGIHIHWQFLPVPAELVAKGLVEAAFKVEAENEKYPAFTRKAVGDGKGEGGNYFRVWIWRPSLSESTPHTGRRNGATSADDAGEIDEKETELVLPLDTNFRFDLQFGRRVMAKLLGLEKRVNWRDCGQEEGDEKADAEAFKKAFREFDFSVEE